MACDTWIPHLVALVYDELEPDDADRLRAHLVTCHACAEAVERLRNTREVLQEAVPSVPDVPRVVILARPDRWRAWRPVAAGLVVATLVGAGTVVGYALAPRPATPLPAPDDWALQGPTLERRISDLETAIARGQAVGPGIEAARPAATRTPVTEKQMRSALTELERRLDGSRAADIDYVLGEIRASERRTQSWIGDTREALRYVALANNPGVGQH